MKNNGSKSEDLFEKILNEGFGKLVFIERLPDTKSIKGLLRSGFVQGRPSDYLVTLAGSMFYAEVKSCSDPVSFSFSNFRKDQWRAMKKQRAAGGKYYCFIHNLLTNEWYVVEGARILDTEEQGTKSLKWKDMTKWTLNTPM